MLNDSFNPFFFIQFLAHIPYFFDLYVSCTCDYLFSLYSIPYIAFTYIPR